MPTTIKFSALRGSSGVVDTKTKSVNSRPRARTRRLDNCPGNPTHTSWSHSVAINSAANCAPPKQMYSVSASGILGESTLDLTALATSGSLSSLGIQITMDSFDTMINVGFDTYDPTSIAALFGGVVAQWEFDGQQFVYRDNGSIRAVVGPLSEYNLFLDPCDLLAATKKYTIGGALYTFNATTCLAELGWSLNYKVNIAQDFANTTSYISDFGNAKFDYSGLLNFMNPPSDVVAGSWPGAEVVTNMETQAPWFNQNISMGL